MQHRPTRPVARSFGFGLAAFAALALSACADEPLFEPAAEPSPARVRVSSPPSASSFGTGCSCLALKIDGIST